MSPIMPPHGRGVQGPRRPDAPEAAGPAVQERRPDAERARGAPADDAFRGDEAPADPREGRPRRDEATRAREAALPESRPDPARPRPMGEQIRRAVGRGPERPQTHAGGQDDGESI